jgi:hypothetical protein
MVPMGLPDCNRPAVSVFTAGFLQIMVILLILNTFM